MVDKTEKLKFSVKFMVPIGQIWQGPCNRPEALIEIEMTVFPATFDPVQGMELTGWRKDVVNARREKMTPEVWPLTGRPFCRKPKSTL